MGNNFPFFRPPQHWTRRAYPPPTFKVVGADYKELLETPPNFSTIHDAIEINENIDLETRQTNQSNLAMHGCLHAAGALLMIGFGVAYWRRGPVSRATSIVHLLGSIPLTYACSINIDEYRAWIPTSTQMQQCRARFEKKMDLDAFRYLSYNRKSLVGRVVTRAEMVYLHRQLLKDTADKLRNDLSCDLEFNPLTPAGVFNLDESIEMMRLAIEATDAFASLYPLRIDTDVRRLIHVYDCAWKKLDREENAVK